MPRTETTGTNSEAMYVTISSSLRPSAFTSASALSSTIKSRAPSASVKPSPTQQLPPALLQHPQQFQLQPQPRPQPQP